MRVRMGNVGPGEGKTYNEQDSSFPTVDDLHDCDLGVCIGAGTYVDMQVQDVYPAITVCSQTLNPKSRLSSSQVELCTYSCLINVSKLFLKVCSLH